MLASIQVDVKIVTWLRYTAWIPLYPLGMLFEGKSILVVSAYKIAGPHSAVGNVSGYRCVSDCRSRGREFDPGPVPYFHGD